MLRVAPEAAVPDRDSGTAPPADATRDRRALVDVVVCFLLGIGMGLIPWLFRSRFYFHDDMQHQHMPIFLHIGRLLRAGEVPFLSLATVTSGNLLGEYQFALFNPVSLALYAVLPSIPSLANAALFLACFYYGVLTAGVYVLARSYQVERLAAVVAGLVIASNNLICYWFAASWFPIFVSIAWFVWAWAFLARADRTRLDWLLAVVFCYLTITSGWPQTTIMLGVIGLVVAVQIWRSAGFHGGVAVVAALSAAGLLSATALLALMSLDEIAARFRGLINNNVLVPNLRDLLAMSSPFHRGFMSWGGYKLTGTPIFFLAWFVVPLLPLIRWSRVEWRRPEIVTLGVVAALCLIATQGPEEFYMLRWPFRWIPYFHIATTILFLSLASGAGFAPPTRGRLGAVLLLTALSGLSSLQADPEGWRIHLAGIAACIVAVAAFLAVPLRAQTMRFGLFGAVTVLLFTATHALFTTNSDVPDWGVPSRVEAGLRPNAAPGAYTLYLGWLGQPADIGRLDEFETGMVPRMQEAATVNGYTPIGHRHGSEFLCMNIFGETCPELGPRLFERDPESGLAYADLFRINRLIALKGPHLDRLRPVLGRDWQLEFNGLRTQRFVRDLPNAGLPGTVAWLAPNARVEPAGPTHATAERVRISGPRDEPTRIVFARLWWPGYEAEFGGQTLAVQAHRDIFAAVDVPAGAEGGILTLRYRPPRLMLGIAAAIAGGAIILAVLALGGPRGLAGLTVALRSARWGGR